MCVGVCWSHGLRRWCQEHFKNFFKLALFFYLGSVVMSYSLTLCLPRTRDARCQVPDVSLSAPDVSLSAPDVSVSAPDVSVPAPDVSLSAPDMPPGDAGVSVAAPSMPSGDVEASVSVPDVPSVDAKAPKKSLFGKLLKKSSKASVEVSQSA